MSKGFNGGVHYGDWLKTLTPEQLQEHKDEKKLRKSNKKAWELVIEKKQEVIAAALFNSLIAQLEKANKGDTPAFLAALKASGMMPNDKEEVQETDNADMLAAIIALVGKLPD